MELFKGILGSIMETKEYSFVEEEESDYVPFLVNRGLSRHMELIFYSNEMNKNYFLDKKLQYDFLFHSIRGTKRKWAQWDKKQSVDNLDIVKKYYLCSDKKAKEYLNLLSEDQIGILKDRISEGGVSKNSTT